MNNNTLCVNVDWENEKTYDNNLFNLQHFTFCQEGKEFLLAILDLSFVELCWQLSCPCNYVLNQFKLTLLNISKRSPEESLILKLIVLYLSITWELWNETLLTIIAFLAFVSCNYDINQWTWKKEVRQKGSKSANHKTHMCPCEPVELLNFLRGMLRWLRVAKHKTVDWAEFMLSKERTRSRKICSCA